VNEEEAKEEKISFNGRHGEKFIFMLSMDMFIMRIYDKRAEQGGRASSSNNRKISTPFVSARHSDNEKANPLLPK
jgi:hypothetical protein